MAHYALLDENNKVTDVITGVSEDNTDDLPTGFSSWEDWYKDFTGANDVKRTSYNTAANNHTLGGTPFRGNYAGIGMTYDPTNDVFIAPTDHDSWILDETTWSYKAPKDYPDDGKGYYWDETAGDWVENSE